MVELASLQPALGATVTAHSFWWVILALVVFAVFMPMAYFLSRNPPSQQHH